MTIKNKKGFTLIELLVVIAIIGILSGLIIVSMSSANNAAKDARVQASLDQLRTTVELYKVQNNNYGTSATATAQTDCTATASTFMTNTDVTKLCTDIIAQDGTGGTTIKIEDGDLTSAGSTKYCIAADLVGGTAWCIDYTGFSGPVTAITLCDAVNYDCDTD